MTSTNKDAVRVTMVLQYPAVEEYDEHPLTEFFTELDNLLDQYFPGPDAEDASYHWENI